MKLYLIPLAALGAVLVSVSYRFTEAQEKHNGTNSLTRDDLNKIRSIVYELGACTHINTETTLPQREVDLPPDLVAIHRKDRIGTLRLLLAITVGGRSRDAQAAGVLALALEEGPVEPLIFLDADIKTFDSANSNNAPSDREYLVDRVQRSLKKAEEAVKNPRR
jgi:hypothetical protein